MFESHQRYSLAIQATRDGIWERNLITNESVYSPRWCEILGYSFDDLELPHTYQSWTERIHPDDCERVIAALNNHIEKGTEYKVEYRHLHKSGEYKWQKSTGTSVLDKDGKAIKIVGCISDISERKQAENALRQSEEKFRLMFENNPQPMFITDVNTLRFLDANEAAINHYGYTKDEFLSMTIEDIRPIEVVSKMLETVESFRKGNTNVAITKHKKKNGQQIYVEIIMAQIVSNGKKTCHVFVNDITEQKLAEQALEEKMNDMLNFHRLTVGRELTMIELKKEVNELHKELGLESKYHIVK